MVNLTIDGVAVSVPKGTLVIRAAEQMGTYVPRFCDHPLLDPVGACRQCIVEVEGQRKPLTACTTLVAEGMVVRTQVTSEVARDAQDGVLELLLINHPLDCPMCDKGGECPLQDQALAYGPAGSRYIDPKRRFTKPVPISPLVKLDRERCVLCARCTRFSEQIAGEPFIELLERGALEQVAIYEDEPYESVFSGNVVQICPVGALTSTAFRFKARPFDMSSAPSTCTRCASGCAITVQERRGEIVRILGASDLDVNDEWICDKGRYGFAYRGDPMRVTEPLVRKGDEFVAVSWPEALEEIATRVRRARETDARNAVLGGERLLDEDAYALSRFARTVLQTNDVDARLGAPAVPSGVLAAAGATNADIDRAEQIVVLSADLREESPIVFLRVRKAARRGARVVQVGPRRGPLPGAWISCAVGDEAAALPDLSATSVVLAADSAGATAMAAAFAAATSAGARFGWIPRRAGARGALWAGLSPTTLPGGRAIGDADVAAMWGEIPAAPGRNADQILSLGCAEGIIALVGADPVTDYGDHVAGVLAASGSVIALDALLTPSARLAHVVLPAAVAYERDGTITDWEGRARDVHAAVPPANLALPDHRILAQIARAAGVASFPSTLDAIRAEMASLPTVAAPDVAGPPSVEPVKGLRAVVVPVLLDAGTMMLGADALAASARPTAISLSPADAARLSIEPGALIRAASARGHIDATAEISDGVREGHVAVPAWAGGAWGAHAGADVTVEVL